MSVLNARTIEIINNMTPGSHLVGLGDLIEQALSGVLPPGSVSLAEIEMAVTGKVIGSNGVSSANTFKTPGFTGTGATISPTAALSGAPVFSGTAHTLAGTVAAPTFAGTAHTLAGTVAAPTFTGTSPLAALDLATPAFSGTGLTAAGQVMTTTSTHTMTLNQCAGMWLIPATGSTPPMLILSNTAVSGAAAVLTVQGAAATDAGAYKIVKSLTPVGTNSAPTFTGESYTPAGTNSAPTFTGESYTPAGTNSTPTVTVTGASYTPVGTVTLT